jgi:release factor glutamine methyltransferase
MVKRKKPQSLEALNIAAMFNNNSPAKCADDICCNNDNDYDDEVYPPAEDTYLLLDAALAESRSEDIVFEIGSGRGILSVELALKVRRLIATDINPNAILATEARAAKRGMADMIELVRADLFNGISGCFDLVLFNPPYLPTNPEERTGGWIDYALDGGANGRETVNEFLKDLRTHLFPGGRALLLISSRTGLKEVQETASAFGLTAVVVASERCFFEQLHVLRIAVTDSL